jgi:predicted PurR-regulated permease PerM
MFGIDIRAARAVWTAALVIGGLYAVYLVRTTLLVLLIAVLFSYLILPLFVLAQRLLRPRVPRAAVLCLVFLVVLCIVALAAALFGNQIALQASGLAQALPQLLDPATLARRLPLPHVLEPFRARVVAFLSQIVQGGSSSVLPFVRNFGLGLVHVAGNALYVIAVPILSFLMLLEAPGIDELLVTFGKRTQAGFWNAVLHDLNALLSSYVRALALLSLATLVVYGTVLSLLGVPFPLLLAGAAAVLEVIPVLGPLVAAGSVLAVAAFSGYEHLGWLLLFFALYRVFQDYMLNPYLMSSGVSVPAILVVFGLLAGEQLAGIAGVFLSVPFLAAVRVIAVQARHYRERQAQSPSPGLPAGPPDGIG